MPEGRSSAQRAERLRRLRRTPGVRELLKENRLHASDLVAPVFVRDGRNVVEPIETIPGHNRYSVDRVPGYVGRLADLGVKAVLLFGIPGSKDAMGTEAYSRDGVVPRAIRELKESWPSTVVAADVCLCEYTSHGHCGVIECDTVDNEKTLPLLALAAERYAEAGADIVCPSAMMDGQVLAIRRALDGAGAGDRLVMGYSAKYASSFYGPFRDAARSAPSFGDRRGYQMDPANARQAMREIQSDINEGADIVMVKPALPYLDIISRARSRFDVPIAAYSVSGEYSMIRSAAANGWLDERACVLEVMSSIKRAGADIIITYHAEQVATWLGE